MSLKDANLVITAERDRTLREKEAAKDVVQRLSRRIIYLDGILATLRGAVCPECHGHGEHWVSRAQDDTKMEKCSRCKGTGLPS